MKIKKCKVLSRNPGLNTTVFKFEGKESYITGDVIIDDGYVYIHKDEQGRLISVPAPSADQGAPKKTDVKPIEAVEDTPLDDESATS